MQEFPEQPKTIALIGQKGMPASWGGVEQHVHHLALELLKNGHSVTVYSRKHYANEEKARELEAQHPGLRVHFVPTIATKHLDAIVSTLFATLHAIFRVRPQVFHYHGVGPSLLAWLPRLLATRSRVIVTFHSIDRSHAKWGQFARLILTIAEWTAVHIPHVTIAVSQEIQRYVRERYQVEAIYIPNGIKRPEEVMQSEDRALLEMYDLKPQSYVLLVTRFVPHKGVHFAIQAWKTLNTNKRLVIVGDATMGTEEYAQELREMAKSDPRIVMTGYASGDALQTLYVHAYATLHPSLAEGLSIVLLEAASHGKAMIASDIPENWEILQHGGLPFEPGNVAALAEAVTYALQYPEAVKVAGRSAKIHVLKQYHWTTIAEKTAQVYDFENEYTLQPVHETVSVPTR